MKHMKRFFICLLAIIFVLPFQAQATGNNNGDVWTIKKSDNSIYLQNQETGEIIAEASELDSAGHLIKIDLVAYANQLNTKPKVPDSPSCASFVSEHQVRRTSITYSYREDYSYVGLGSGVKVSPDVVGPATVTYGESTSITESFGGEVSIVASIKTKIQAGASFNWNTSLQSGSQFSAGFSVPSGKTGYIQFRPKYNVTEGTLTQYVRTDSILDDVYTFDVWGRCPIKLATGFADGVYELVLR